MIRQKYLKAIQHWASASKPKPLLLWGARQVGKTTLMRDFAKEYSPNYAYLNFESDKQLHSLFAESLNPKDIVRNLSIYLNTPIEDAETLLIFDEIQESEDALNSLKYFAEADIPYRVIAAGSLLGVRHSKKGFPVGKVEFLDVHPLCFNEFLEMTGQDGLAKVISQATPPLQIPSAIHHKLLEKMKEYMWLGGMPEVVAAHAQEPNNYARQRLLQQQIIRTYQLDFAKYAPSAQIAKIGEIFAQIPSQIAKENKKFQMSGISKQARLREYSESLQWLINAGMVHKVTHVSQIDVPLSAHADDRVFKLYLLDTGLLGAMLDVPVKLILDQTELFASYKGALTENYVSQQLMAKGIKDLYYWTAAGAELDFLVSLNGIVYPLEVKSGINVRSKSLTKFGDMYRVPHLSRGTALPYQRDGAITNYPLYALQHFPAWTPSATDQEKT